MNKVGFRIPKYLRIICLFFQFYIFKIFTNDIIQLAAQLQFTDPIIITMVGKLYRLRVYNFVFCIHVHFKNVRSPNSLELTTTTPEPKHTEAPPLYPRQTNSSLARMVSKKYC